MKGAPETCLYCDGEGNGPGSPCGFCEDGKPLDTQEDWDKSWGKLFDERPLNVETYWNPALKCWVLGSRCHLLDDSGSSPCKLQGEHGTGCFR